MLRKVTVFSPSVSDFNVTGQSESSVRGLIGTTVEKMSSGCAPYVRKGKAFFRETTTYSTHFDSLRAEAQS